MSSRPGRGEENDLPVSQYFRAAPSIDAATRLFAVLGKLVRSGRGLKRLLDRQRHGRPGGSIG